MLLFLGIVFFILLVVVHEYGHYLVARRNGVEAEEFGIGFPPKIAGKTMGKGIFRTYYSINLLPIGGFVRLKGGNDSDTRKGSFGAASLWIKAKIALAGVAMNWVMAAVIFTILAWVGMPQLVKDQFSVKSDAKVLSNKVLLGMVVEDSPASRAGLQYGDQIVKFNGQEVSSGEDLPALTQENAGQQVQIDYVREGETKTTTAALNKDRGDTGYLGVSPADLSQVRSTWSAPIVGVGLTAQLSWETLKGLGGLVGSLVQGQTEEAGNAVCGPVCIVGLLGDVSKDGPTFMLFIIAILSLTLAVMNSLPIPALDGGRLFVTLLFKAIRKPLTPQLEQSIHGTGMIVLLGLIALVTVVDIGKL